MIRTIRLDSLLPLLHSHTLVLKLDIEGYECEALMGAGRLLRTHRVAFVLMEWDGGHSAAARGCDWDVAVRPLWEQDLTTFRADTRAPMPFRVGDGFTDKATGKHRSIDIFWAPRMAPRLSML